LISQSVSHSVKSVVVSTLLQNMLLRKSKKARKDWNSVECVSSWSMSMTLICCPKHNHS